MRTLVVLNPASAGGRTALRWTRIGHALQAQGVEHRLHRTSGPGDATAAVRAALRDGCERVVAVGGDGTLNEVVNGFFTVRGEPLRPQARLGFIPSGTGGDFRKSSGIPIDAEDCAHLVAHAPGRAIDVGRIDFGDGSTRFFLNIADCGIGGEVVAAVNRSRFKGGGARGSAVFLAISLRTLLRYRGRRARVVLDGDAVEVAVQSIVVANGRYFGGGMRIAPDASLDDGLFDVVTVEALGRRRALSSLPSLYRGTHVTNRAVRVRRAARVEITSLEDELLFDVEGEQVGRTPAVITCLPRAVLVCAPAND